MNNRPLSEQMDPDRLDHFHISEGRYFATMFFLRLPQSEDDEHLKLGGDVNALIWRKDDEPNKWTAQWRFRYYKSRQPWDSGDEKQWFAAHAEGSEEAVVSSFEGMLQLLAAAAGFPLEKFEIRGDNEKFFRLVKTNPPPWMHFGLPDEQANKGGDPHNN